MWAIPQTMLLCNGWEGAGGGWHKQARKNAEENLQNKSAKFQFKCISMAECGLRIYDKRKTFWVDFSAFLVSAKSTKCNKYFFWGRSRKQWLGPLIDSISIHLHPDSGSRANGQGPKPKDRTLNEAGGQHLLVRDPAKEFMCVEGNRKAFFMHASNLWPNKACVLGQIATIHHPPHPLQPLPLFSVSRGPAVPENSLSNIYSQIPPAGNASPVNRPTGFGARVSHVTA